MENIIKDRIEHLKELNRYDREYLSYLDDKKENEKKAKEIGQQLLNCRSYAIYELNYILEKITKEDE